MHRIIGTHSGLDRHQDKGRLSNIKSKRAAIAVPAMLKLQNVETFATMFLNYDLLAKRWVPYSYIYPYAEGPAGVLMVVGVLMVAGVANWLSVPVALVIGGIGAASVFKAVYIDKRELKCACVGGSSNVPLGFISLTENLMMIAMAVWMASAHSGIMPGIKCDRAASGETRTPADRSADSTDLAEKRAVCISFFSTARLTINFSPNECDRSLWWCRDISGGASGWSSDPDHSVLWGSVLLGQTRG